VTVFDVRRTSPELAAARLQTAVLPIGSIEQHGRALPLATDWLEADAGELEVSLVLAIEPDLVRMTTPADVFVPGVTHEHMDYRRLRDVSPSGVWGRPSHGTRDKGRLAITAMAERVATHVEAVFTSLGLPQC
jgi:creatinine amidohydrolase/Fe(II)-dependent formamide hydrolase-like protein